MSPRILVAQFAKPIREDFGLANLDHLSTIVHRRIFFKHNAAYGRQPFRQKNGERMRHPVFGLYLTMIRITRKIR
jgi:hypothetical protein